MWEGATSYLRTNTDYVTKFQEDAAYAGAFARIECHYFVNKGFLKSDNQLIDDVGRIRHIPAVDRAGALRHGVPDAQRLASAQSVAGSGSAHRRRRRPLRVRGRHHQRADYCNGSVRAVEEGEVSVPRKATA